MKIDLHVHSRERSACGRSGEEEMIRAAAARGLDGLAFTDHHCLVPTERLAELNRRYTPFRVFGGVEVSVVEGEDVLVLGVRDPALKSRDWFYSDLFTFVHARAGFLVLAHPFRYHDTIQVDIEHYPPDAIELCSKNTRASDEPRIREIAERFGLRPLCNSDAHEAKHVGLYHNQLGRTPRDERELLEVLRAGDYTCHSLGRATAFSRSRGTELAALAASDSERGRRRPVKSLKQLLWRWLPPVVWMGLIFVLSAQPDLPQAPGPWLDTVLKKTAHTLAFGLLAWLYLRALRQHLGHLAILRLVSAGLALLYALSDEYHQTFVPGRQGRLLDVAVDSAGICGAILLHWWLACRRHSLQPTPPARQPLAR
jgi:VanZ family protein